MNKKLLACAMSLVMIFSLVPSIAFATETGDNPVVETTADTRDTTGYAGAELPAGPDMSGTVITVTPENAQYTLDGAYGSIDGKTIHFSSGTYTDTLVLGRPTKFTNSNTKYYKSSDNTELTYDQVVSVKGTNHGMYIYERSLSGVTFTADDDVVLPGFYVLSGLVKNENSNYNYVLEETVTGTGDSGYAYYGRSNLSNITFDGLTISGSIDLNNGHSTYYGSTSGLTIENCTFTGNESIWNTSSADGYGLNAILFRSYTSGNTHAIYQDIEIKGCTIENYGFGFYVQYITDLTVTNNSFTNIKNNAIQTSKDVSGVIDIEENLIKNVLDRAFRLDNASDATSITLKNNVILNSGDSDGENFKATSLLSDTSAVSLEYNYWAGETASTAVNNSDYVPSYVGIIGGTFPEDVGAYAYTGYAGVENSDGTYTVIPAAFTTADTVVTVAAGTYTYDGTAKTPSVTVTHCGYTLTQGTDYTVSYSNNVNAGTATVTVTGTGSYSGTVSATFVIDEADVVGMVTKEATGDIGSDAKTVVPVDTDALLDDEDLVAVNNGSNIHFELEMN